MDPVKPTNSVSAFTSSLRSSLSSFSKWIRTFSFDFYFSGTLERHFWQETSAGFDTDPVCCGIRNVWPGHQCSLSFSRQDTWRYVCWHWGRNKGWIKALAQVRWTLTSAVLGKHCAGRLECPNGPGKSKNLVSVVVLLNWMLEVTADTILDGMNLMTHNTFLCQEKLACNCHFSRKAGPQGSKTNFEWPGGRCLFFQDHSWVVGWKNSVVCRTRTVKCFLLLASMEICTSFKLLCDPLTVPYSNNRNFTYVRQQWQPTSNFTHVHTRMLLS